MYKIFVVFAVVALFCSNASASEGEKTEAYSKEQTKSFETCTAGLKPSITGDHDHWVPHTLASYVKSMDKAFASRLKEIFLTGRENRTVDSLCVIETSEHFAVGKSVEDNYTSASLGVVVPSENTLHSNGLINTVFYLPNSKTVALTVNWMIVLSDEHTYALLEACLPDGHRGFALFTTEDELEPESIEAIKTHLKKSGLDDNLDAGELHSTARCSNYLRPTTVKPTVVAAAQQVLPSLL